MSSLKDCQGIDSRRQVANVNAAIQAKRDFWLAESNLQMAMTGSGAGSVSLSGGAAMTADAGGGH